MSGYRVQGATYKLTQFGLPQIRERAFVVAAKRHLPLYTLEDLWAGWRVDRSALTVRRTIAEIGRETNEPQSFPGFSSESVRDRIAAIPQDGGSWVDLLGREDEDQLLTESMKKIVKEKRFGSYPDVYGRMAWDRPAPTIKRECAHVGNGRYAHPEEDRLCSVREMAALQGFPRSFQFNGAAISNLYRHIGDAVPTPDIPPTGPSLQLDVDGYKAEDRGGGSSGHQLTARRCPARREPECLSLRPAFQPPNAVALKSFWRRLGSVVNQQFQKILRLHQKNLKVSFARSCSSSTAILERPSFRRVLTWLSLALVRRQDTTSSLPKMDKDFGTYKWMARGSASSLQRLKIYATIHFI